MKDCSLKLNMDKTEVLILGPTPSAWDDSWWPTALGTSTTPTDTYATSASYWTSRSQ